MPRGIRFRITLVAIVSVAVVLVATGAALLASQRRILTQNIDEVLAATSISLERMYRAGELPNQIAAQGDEDSVAQIVDITSGAVIASTANFSGQPALPSPATGETVRRVVRLPAEPSALSVALPVRRRDRRAHGDAA